MKTLSLNIIISILVFASMQISCKKDSSPPANNNNNNNGQVVYFTLNEKKLSGNDNIFGLELFKKLSNSKSLNENLMISPLSVALALGMTYNGADGTTRTEMEEVLNLNGMSVTEINESYKGLIDKLKSLDANVVFNIANSIWYSNTFSVLPDFLNTNSIYFYSEVTPLDFSQSDAKDIINKWVSDKTNKKIEEIVDDISPETVMFLINAIYFKGIWKYTFDKKETKIAPFYMEDGNTKDVKMMKQKVAKIKVFQNNLFSAAELPYGKEQYSMIVMVPSGDKTANDIISQMDDNNWNLWLNSFYEAPDSFTVTLPKFKFKYEKSLKQILSDIGMGIAFSDMANFSKINSSADLKISEVKHKTYIDVDEQGTEAAAVTSVEIINTSWTFDNLRADRPFLFVIKEKQTNVILFIGKVAEPVYE